MFFLIIIYSNVTHIFIVSILYLGKRSTYGCYGVIHGVVGGDAMKINWLRVKPLFFVKVTYLVDMQKYM